MKIVFVILHYENVEDTNECLESLKKYMLNKDVQVVVVDNGSVQGRLDELAKLYKEFEMFFLRSDINLGFAKGNNLGFRFAKEKLGADIIILANNDLIFKQIDFIECIEKDYLKRKFDVAGPRIISLVDNKNQNPVPVLYDTVWKLYKRIIKYGILYVLSFVGWDCFITQNFSKEIIEYVPKNGEKYQLHGACMIFGSGFIKKFDGLFEGTFMYNEESILFQLVEKSNLKMLYCEDLTVYHKEGASTESVHGAGREKRKFYYKWNLHSCIKLLKIMNK